MFFLGRREKGVHGGIQVFGKTWGEVKLRLKMLRFNHKEDKIMGQTANYQLNQWVKTDRIMMEDFNSDNAKIDAALKANADAVATKAENTTVSALQAAVALCGNCKVVTTSYAGTGTCGSANAKSLTFEKPPLAVLIFGKEIGLTAPGTDMKVLRVSSEATSNTTWATDKKSISWYHTDGEAYMLNSSGYTYNVVIFYTA